MSVPVRFRLEHVLFENVQHTRATGDCYLKYPPLSSLCLALYLVTLTVLVTRGYCSDSFYFLLCFLAATVRMVIALVM